MLCFSFHLLAFVMLFTELCAFLLSGSLASKSNFDQLSYLFQCVVKASEGPRRTISGWVVDISDNLDLSLFLLMVILCRTEIMILPSLSQVLAGKKRPLTFLTCYSGRKILGHTEIRGWILHSKMWFSAAILSTGNWSPLKLLQDMSCSFICG